jgi:hypothetical protein
MKQVSKGPGGQLSSLIIFFWNGGACFIKGSFGKGMYWGVFRLNPCYEDDPFFFFKL